jgi:hypothetical protein
MTLLNHVHGRLSALGLQCSIVGNELHVHREPRPVKIKFEEDWCNEYQEYKRARSISFDAETRSFQRNNSFEFQVTRLAAVAQLAPEQYNLVDEGGHTVTIGSASHSFSFGFFDSPAYDEFFKIRVKSRLLDRDIFVRRASQIFWSPMTAVYTHKGRKTPLDLKEKALSAIRASLFKVAVEQHECFSVWKPRKPHLKYLYFPESKFDNSIPHVTYEENVVSFYKVAKASPFPSQSFLAYYNVLEYYFLRVSELLLHDRLASLLNYPGFRANREALDKVISAVRGQDSRSDETEMLRNVLDRFVQESDLIDFIQKFEELCGDKIYSKRRQVFGESLQISLIKDHALANSAKVLKHIRNAIVHSSDRYKREECHIPLSDSEAVIEEFVPLIRFFAERVIFGTAS